MKLSEIKVELSQTARLLANEPELLAKVQRDVASTMGDLNSRDGSGKSTLSVKMDGKQLKITDKRTAYTWSVNKGAKEILFCSEIATKSTEDALGVSVEWTSFPPSVSLWIAEERKKLKEAAEKAAATTQQQPETPAKPE